MQSTDPDRPHSCIMQFDYKLKKDIRIIVFIALMGSLVGIAFPPVIRKDFSADAIFAGFLTGFSITFLCAVGNFFFLPRFSRLPFTIYLLIKSVYFTVVTLIVVMVRLFSGGNVRVLVQTKTILLIAVGITLGISFVVNAIFMLRRMLGQNALLNFFTGRYHRPKEEERIFMFLDIASSTTIAERIGHMRFHVFLNSFFCDITDAILALRGEIYKYVGDEVIVNWGIEAGVGENRCIQSFFEIKKAIEKKSETYLQDYGFVPGFRAGIHCGIVVVGEMGDYKREIAFLGDTVNTTARILEAAGKHNRELMISSDLLEQLNLTGVYQIENMGMIKLRGKEKDIGLFSVQKC